VDAAVDRAVLLAGDAREARDEPRALLAQALAAGERRLLDGDRRGRRRRAARVAAEGRQRRARLGLGREQLHGLGEDRLVGAGGGCRRPRTPPAPTPASAATRRRTRRCARWRRARRW